MLHVSLLLKTLFTAICLAVTESHSLELCFRTTKWGRFSGLSVWNPQPRTQCHQTRCSLQHLQSNSAEYKRMLCCISEVIYNAESSNLKTAPYHSDLNLDPSNVATVRDVLTEGTIPLCCAWSCLQLLLHHSGCCNTHMPWPAGCITWTYIRAN